MQPTDPIAPTPAPVPTPTLPEAPVTPPKKSRKKLIIGIVIGVVVLLIGASVAAVFVLNNTKKEDSSSSSSSADGVPVWTDNPEELYFNNVALYTNAEALYHETDDESKKLLVDEGRYICDMIKKDQVKADGTTFKTDASALIISLIYGAFATTKGSICPDQRPNLEKLANESTDNAFYFSHGRSLLYDGTMSFDRLYLAQGTCFTQAALIFGSSATKTIEQAQEDYRLVCASFRGSFASDVEYYNWAGTNQKDVDTQLVKSAKELGVYTGICAKLPGACQIAE